MKKNKVLVTTLIMLLLGIFCQMKTADATKINVYDPRTDQYYEVQIHDPYYVNVNEELAKATDLPKNLFLIDSSDLLGKDSYDLELPISQITKDGVLYNIYRNHEVVVAGLADGNLEDQEVVIASEVNRQKVTKIGADAFINTRISSVTFEPNSEIKSIGGRCFCSCTALKNITLPNSLTSIRDLCFSGCVALKEIALPNLLTSIGDECFNGCSALTSITLPNSLTKINYECFFSCKALKNITLPNSLTSLDERCFDGCSSLKNITLPNSLKSVGRDCFTCCRSLANITLPNSLTSIGSYCFYGCSSLTNITLPNSLNSIGDCCFMSCSSLQQVNLGNNSQLKHLGNHIFCISKIDEQKFRDRLDAIHQFQNAEKRRADRLASMINLTDQKYQEELRDIYSLFNRRCSTEDLIFAYEALTRKIGYSLGEDNPDFIKMRQGRKYYAEQLSWIKRERALEMMRIESYK